MQTNPHRGDAFNILSMGMSNDFEVAIECGANFIRVGSALFNQVSETAGEDPQTLTKTS